MQGGCVSWGVDGGLWGAVGGRAGDGELITVVGEVRGGAVKVSWILKGEKRWENLGRVLGEGWVGVAAGLSQLGEGQTPQTCRRRC